MAARHNWRLARSRHAPESCLALARQAAAYILQPPRASERHAHNGTRMPTHTRASVTSMAARQAGHNPRLARTYCSRRERRSATHPTAHARPHTRERATRQWQHGRRAATRARRDHDTSQNAGRAEELLGTVETGGSVQSAVAASVGAPRTQRHTHAHTHESAPHVNGSTASGPQLAPGAITTRPRALAMLERAAWHCRDRRRRTACSRRGRRSATHTTARTHTRARHTSMAARQAGHNNSHARSAGRAGESGTLERRWPIIELAERRPCWRAQSAMQMQACRTGVGSRLGRFHRSRCNRHSLRM